MNYKNIKKCRICKSRDLTKVISFPKQFLSPTFVKSNKNNKLSNIKVPLMVVLCNKKINPNNCGLLQLRETTNPDLLYKEYFYKSSTNDTMRKDLREVVKDIQKHIKLLTGDIVVDIGSNDNYTLSLFSKRLRRVGVEPAKNISFTEFDPSIETVNDYFSEKSVRNVIGGKKVKVFMSCAMFYDLEDPNTFMSEIKSMLDYDGIFCIQLSYLPAMIRNMNFYDICHEHLEYYSLLTLDNLMKRHNLSIIDATENAVNGGSIRIYIVHKERKISMSKNLKKLFAKEKKMGLFDVETYTKFYNKIIHLGKTVKQYIINEINNGETVIGLGASTKGNVLLQFFNINKKILPYISEINPKKIGLRTLGTDIELISDEQAKNINPICKLVLPWYFKKEIIKREKNYLKNWGRLLFPMPYPHVVTREGEFDI